MCTTSYDNYLDVRTRAGVFRVCVTADPYGMNPRDDEGNTAKIVCPQRREFTMPCEPDDTDRDLMWQILRAFELGHDGARVALRYLSVVHNAVALPIYGYQMYWTGDLGDPVDSQACMGVIYVKRADVAREWRDNLTDADIAAQLARQVADYSAWANGEMTGYVIERATCREPDHTDCGSECWQLIDSCGTYYSESEAMEAGRDSVPESLSDYDLAALAALDAARRACGIADCESLASEANGACGAVVDAFRSAAADLLGEWMADRLYELLVSTGDGDVSACLARVASEPDCGAS